MCSSGPTAKSSAASYDERGIWYLVAENKRISQDILVPPDMRGSARPGQVVVAEVIEQPSAHREALAKVIEVLGNYTDPGHGDRDRAAQARPALPIFQPPRSGRRGAFRTKCRTPTGRAAPI